MSKNKTVPLHIAKDLGPRFPPKLKKTIKRKWLQALRGKAYKQGTGALARLDGTMCPIGVAHDLFSDSWWIRDDKAGTWELKHRTYPLKGGVERLWFANPVGYFVALYHIADLNDRGYSFREIAEYIDRNL